jgi:hypothetical protein
MSLVSSIHLYVANCRKPGQKRLHRKHNGDDYIHAMVSDLTHRNEPRYLAVLSTLEKLTVDPNFNEEWD